MTKLRSKRLMIKRVIKIFVCICFCALYSFDIKAQSQYDSDTVTYFLDGVETNDSMLVTDDDIDAESEVIYAQGQEAQKAVDIVLSIVDLIEDIEQSSQDVKRYVIYEDSPSIVEIPVEQSIDTTVTQKFDLIQGKDNEDYDFTFVRQTIYNNNRQAWDYVYERIYNQEGNLISFVRRYNTYNSSCAQVAFERSEYFYDDKGDLVQKTYEIFDSDNNELNLDDCWMERESYEKYPKFQEFLQQYPLQ